MQDSRRFAVKEKPKQDVVNPYSFVPNFKSGSRVGEFAVHRLQDSVLRKRCRRELCKGRMWLLGQEGVIVLKANDK